MMADDVPIAVPRSCKKSKNNIDLRTKNSGYFLLKIVQISKDMKIVV